ncbi:SH3 domain-containing protein [Streptomyces agglomeratus]|uniref:SH3 domain-containing protein n=1 Tax=Streptomyces agglomeratus TaxID=285458 RepID=UPI000D1B3EC2
MPRGQARDASGLVSNDTNTSRVAKDGNGVNYRTGPGTGYSSKGFLYSGDDLRVYCGKGDWYYTKLIYRSKSGLPAGTYGWIRSDMLLQLAG